MSGHMERAGMKGMKLSQSPLNLPYISMGQAKTSRVVHRRHLTDFHMEPVLKKRKPVDIEECSQTSPCDASTNHETRRETSRRQELVNCTCGYQEEEGIMIQCYLCLCWQHGLCHKIQHEDEVPEKYICVFCRHPSRERPSKRFLHDQDWLKKGCLPTLSFRSKNDVNINQRTTILKQSNDLIGTIMQLQNVIHSLRVKVNIAENADHPKLYLWSQSWEKGGLCQTPSFEVTVPTGSDLGSQLPEVGDWKEGKPSMKNIMNLNQLDRSSNGPSHIQLPIGSSVDHNVDSDVADCQPTNIEIETSDTCSVRDNKHLMADDWDAKDTNFSQGSLSIGSGDNVPSEVLETQADTKDYFPYLSNEDILSNTCNVETDTEVSTSAIVSEQEKTESIAKDTERVELKEHDDPDASHNSDTRGKDELTNTRVGCEGYNDLQLSFCQKDLVHLATSMGDKLSSFTGQNEIQSNFINPQRVPQPETPIVAQECQSNLLDHIEAFHQQLELRLTSLETEIAGLENMDTYLGHDENSDQETRETVQMLIQDLSLLRDAASIN